MSLRSLRERIIQTLSYEAGGLLLAAPAYALVFGKAAHESFILVAAMSITAMAWAGLHNTLFDVAEMKLSARVASDRAHGWRAVHALSTEATSVLVTLPVIMWLGGYGFWAALVVDIGFTLFYAAYGYGFHWLFDWLRPVRHVRPVAEAPPECLDDAGVEDRRDAA